MELKQFFTEHPKVAIAFSGGVDSAYLLYAAAKCGAQVKAYYEIAEAESHVHGVPVRTLHGGRTVTFM